MKRFPESAEGVKERAVDFTNEFKRLHSVRSGKRTLKVVVCHGTPIRMCSLMHGGSKKKVKFCGVTAVAITPGEEQFRLLCNCKSNHDKVGKYCNIF